jgi:hypothetical protein
MQRQQAVVVRRFATMPRPQRRPPQKRPLPPPSRRTAGTIDRYYLSSHCAVRP